MADYVAWFIAQWLAFCARNPQAQAVVKKKMKNVGLIQVSILCRLPVVCSQHNMIRMSVAAWL